MNDNAISVIAVMVLSVILCLPGMSLAEVDTWTRKADMPTARQWFSASVVNGKIYAIGGTLSGGTLGGLSQLTPIVEEYDPATDTWTRKADTPTARAALATTVVNGKIYAIGGWNSGNPNLSTVEEYDPETDTWTTKTDMPTGRAFLSAAAVNGKIYAIGGYSTILSTVEEYDPLTDTWTKRADAPTPIFFFDSGVVDGIIYVIGGQMEPNAGPLSTVYAYDPLTDTWTRKADMPTAGALLATSVVNGKIYAIGGEERSAVEEYDPSTDTWTRKADMSASRSGLSASAANGRIYAIGGLSRFGDPPLPTVEEYDTGTGIPWIVVRESPPRVGKVTGGEPIAIFGSNFPPDVIVTIGGKPLLQLKVTDVLIEGVTPPGEEGEHDILITTPRIDFTVFAGEFFYEPVSNIVVTGIAPANGGQAGGNVGSIAGDGFMPGARVTIGGAPATDVDVTSILITFTIPPGTEGAKDVVVTNPDGQSGILRNAYSYNPLPIIGEIQPKYGGPLEGGTEIIITGEYFMPGVAVYIGENRVSRLSLFSPTELRLETPSGTPGVKAVRAVNPDGQEAILEAGFTYNEAPVISGVKPDAGALEGGTRITIMGDYFSLLLHKWPDVFIGGAEASYVQVASSTRITVTTPPSDAGVRDIVVINSDGQKAILEEAFTYNPAPVITDITPDNGRLSGGTRITIRGSGFLPGAKVFFSTDIHTDIPTYIAAASTREVSSKVIIAVTPPGKPGSKDVVVRNTDRQRVVLENGFTYNPLPTIISITPNYGSSAGGTKIIIEGTGFLQGARVAIGERAATTQVEDDTTIQAVTPSNPQGVWDVRIFNPDTQEVIMTKGFISVGEVAYNYPNPFRASQGTTFRYVTDDPVQSITVKIFNLAGVPIDVVQQTDSNEVKWHNSNVHAGLYVYLMEVEPESGNIKQFRGTLEVYE